MKSEKAMGELLKNVSKECCAEPIANQLRKIGKAFIGKHVVGTPQAALRVMFKWLIRKSRKVQYVNSTVKDERVSLPKSKQLLEELEDDDDDDSYGYSAWPDDLEDMSLAKCVVMYDSVDQSSAGSSHEGHDLQDNIHDDDNDDDDDDDDSQVHVVKCNSGNLSFQKNEVVTLKNGLGYIRK